MMKKILISLILLLIYSCQSTESENSIAIVIHGGAGTILKENMTPELESAYLDKLEEEAAGLYPNRDDLIGKETSGLANLFTVKTT